MFAGVPKLSKEVSFIEVDLDGCKVFIPCKVVEEDKIPKFTKLVQNLYKIAAD